MILTAFAENIGGILVYTNTILQAKILGAAIDLVRSSTFHGASKGTMLSDHIWKDHHNHVVSEDKVYHQYSEFAAWDIRRFFHHQLEEKAEQLAIDDDIEEQSKESTEYQIRALFHLWKQGMISGDVTMVLSRYSPNAVLVPLNLETITEEASVPINGKDAIDDYLTRFLETHRLTDIRILRGDITMIPTDEGQCSWALDQGIYEFETQEGSFRANYSFVYGRDARGHWKIANHASAWRLQSATPRQENGEPTAPHRRPSHVHRLVGLLTRQQSVTQADLILLSMRGRN